LSGLPHFSAILGCKASSHQQVREVGKELIAEFCGRNVNESLNAMKFRIYMSSCANSTRLPQPEMFANRWIETGGWRLIEGKYVPISSNKDPAPDELLNVVICRCKNDSENQCGKPPCYCYMNGLNCVTACKYCSGVSCNNPTTVVTDMLMEEARLNDACHELFS